nr:hypothetical protein HMPREF0276_1793 [Corynebacterium accolens ATCC 49725]
MTAATSEKSAHPRSRGEHGFARDFKDSCDGSSPLTRGAHLEY